MNTQARRARFEELAVLLMEPLRRFPARRTDPDTAQDALSETLTRRRTWRRCPRTVPPGCWRIP
ncbi:hypothetical protein [Actinoplanes auranticolor]|uniref:Uncharacterized protein n=1 Tax=Actinoplanes auranticolor TaxID=47988 RepID=A0A919S3W9_9ACTN|nr:hypothetical protein [Actinoplanes auranticolor]GIM63804.1 hypothetical protein Aau02nite_06440 [Actinoplanes auranticolor]